MKEVYMQYAVCKLAKLITVKNEINRRRRRFYHLMRMHDKRPEWATKQYKIQLKRWGKVHTKKAASKGYEEACKEMRAMTTEMRQLCKDIGGARLKWGDSWNIQGFFWGDKGGSQWHSSNYYDLEKIEFYADAYDAEEKLLA